MKKAFDIHTDFILGPLFNIYNHPKERSERARILHEYATEKLTWNAVTKKILDIIRHDITLQ